MQTSNCKRYEPGDILSNPNQDILDVRSVEPYVDEATGEFFFEVAGELCRFDQGGNAGVDFGPERFELDGSNAHGFNFVRRPFGPERAGLASDPS